MSALMLLKARRIRSLVLIGPPPDLLKAVDTPPGTRWITVHPHGKDEEGLPVLIRESATHPGTYHVVGGAGGKLTHMTLTHVDPSKWKERRKERQQQKREKLRSLKERGQIASVEAGDKEISEASRRAKREFVDTVAQKLGWDTNWYRDAKNFQDEEDLDPTSAKLAANAHLASWVKKAKAAHKDLVETIRRDHEAQVSAGLGNLSLDTNPYKASEQELVPDAMRDKIQDHREHAQRLRAEADQKRGQMASAYSDLAAIVRQADEDDSGAIDKLLEKAGGEHDPGIAKVLDRLEEGRLSPEKAANAIQKVADAVAKGEVPIIEDDRAHAHERVAQLYSEAQQQIHQPEVAAKLVEEAKKLAGDRGVTALDIIGQQQSEGRGYKSPTKKRAVADVIEMGDVDPSTLRVHIKNVDREIARMESEGPMMYDGMRPVGVIHALNEQKKALLRAQAAAKKGDARLAAKHFLQAERYALSAQKHAEREAPQQAAIVGMVNQMKEARQSVADLKADGAIGAPDIEPATNAMASAVDIIAAAEKLKERERELKEARQLLTDDPEQARQVALDAERVNWDEMDPDKLDAAIRRSLERSFDSTAAASAKALLDRLDDHDFFSSYGGGRQITEGVIAKYIAQGRDAAMTLLGQVDQGAPYLDRSTLDLVGPKAGARMVADYMASRYVGREAEFEGVKQGLIRYHQGRAQEVAESALRACDAAMEQAREFEKVGISSSYDLSEMERYNRLRLDAVNQAMSAVGVAWGELNMTAELNWALANATPRGDHLLVRPENRDDNNLINISRALGFREGEYSIIPEKVSRKGEVQQMGGLAINGDGVEKVMRQPDHDVIARSRRMNNLRSGLRDKPGWLPHGFARRQIDTWNMPEQRPDRYDFSESDLHDALGSAATPEAAEEAIRHHLVSKYNQGVPVEHLPRSLGQQIDHFLDEQRATHGEVTPAMLNANYARQRAMLDIFDTVGQPTQAHHEAARQRLAELASGSYGTEAAKGVEHQQITNDRTTVEAVHRAIAANPFGALAFTPLAGLSAGDRKHLRGYFLRYMTQGAPAEDAPVLPTGEDDGIDHDSFGNDLPESEDTKGNAKDARWSHFVSGFRRPEYAYQAIQGHLKNQSLRSFVQHHNGLRGADDRLMLDDRIDPQAGPRYMAAAPIADYNRMEERLRMGANDDPLDAARQHYREGGYENAIDPNRPMATIGEKAEAQLAPIWNSVAQNFVPGKFVKMMPNLSMSGRYVNQQRMIKAIRQVKRLGVFAGVGSGKTAISLGGFTDAYGDNEARAALFAVPQNMQGQFGAEAATYIDPNSGIRVHAMPGTGGEERQRILASKGHHIAVTTHQSLRDDTIRAIAEHRFGGDEEEAKAAMRTEPRGVRAQMVRDAFHHKGWDHRLDYFAVDEGHEAVNRQGKENSILANVIDAISDNAKHYVALTGTPVKNDPSEAYDWLSKIDPERYPESGLEDFMIRYGGIGQQVSRIDETRRGQRKQGGRKNWGNMAIAEALQHELSPYFYSTRVPLDTILDEKNVPVPLSKAHQARYDRVTELYSRASSARQQGAVDTDAIRELSPNSFAGVPAELHDARARQLLPSLGMLREAAYNRALHTEDAGGHNSKNDVLSKMVRDYRKMPSQRTTPDGKPIKGRAGIVFTSGLDAANQLAERLGREGHRVGLITGQMSAKEKEDAKLGFQPADWKQNGDQNAKYDILVCSNAVSAGADMPRAEFVIHHDVPMTAKTHEQRTARAHRLSNDVNVDMRNLVSNTPHELTNLARLRRKYALADVFQNPAENVDDTGMQSQINLMRAAESGGAAERRVRGTGIGGVRFETGSHHAIPYRRENG